MTTRSVAVNLLLNPAGYTAGAAQVNRANAAMTASTTATATRATAATGTMTAGMNRTGASMANVAGQAGLLRSGVATPIAAVGAAVVGTTKASIDWESSWAGVTKTVDGSATQMERLEGDLRNMAKELPATHGEIASVAEAAGQLGVETESVADFSRVMIDLGETTNLSADQAATSIARLTNIMGTADDDVDNLGSALVDLGNNSATTEAEILTLGQRLAAAGNIAGLSESDVLAFAATLTSVGVNAEAGGTALSKVFTSVRDAVVDGSDQLQTFAEVAGVTADEFATAFREDPAMAIAEFIAGLGEMNASGQSTTAVFEELELTDQRLMRALLSTAEAGDLLTDSIDLASDAWEENNALSEEAQNRYDTVAASLSRTRNQITDAAIDIGDVLAPSVERLASDFATLVGGIQRAAKEVQDFPSRLPGVDAPGDEPVLGGQLFGIGPPVVDWSSLWDDTAESTEQAAGMQAKYNAEIAGLQSRVPPATAAMESFTRQTIDAAMETQTGTERLAAYQDQMRSVTDPVFAMQQALVAVDEAQEAYNEAVKEYGAESDEARDASLGLAEAVSGAETAALNGELSFDAFDAKLRRWVEQGAITADQADNIRERVKDLRGEAEDYEDSYTGQMETGGVSKSRAEIQGLRNRARRYRGRYTAQLRTGGTSKAQSEINGLINRAHAYSGTYTANLHLTTSGVPIGQYFGAALLRHDGGPIMHDGGQVMHVGGQVNAGVTRMHDGGLRTDERMIVAQTGEFMMQRSAVDRYGAGFMHAVNEGTLGRAMAPVARPMAGGGGGGVMEFRHTFVPGPGVGGAFAEMANEALRNGQLNIRTEAIAR